MKTTKLLAMAATLLMACAAPNDDEPVGGANEQLSQSDAYDRVLAEGTFKDRGHLACGRTLTLEGGAKPKGTYTFRWEPCEDEDGARMSSHGTFEVVGGWLGGLLTSPTLKITPDANLEDTTPWSYKVTLDGERVTLTSSTGTGVLHPQGYID